jgi:hypothetical protein
MTPDANWFSRWRKYRSLIALSALVAGTVLWWLFRPELLFIDKHVNEAEPPGIAAIQPAFTGSLHAASDAGETHGRVNILKTGKDLHLEISDLESKADGPFTVALAPTPDSTWGAHVLGTVTTAGHEKLPIPPGIDLASNTAVLLMDPSQRVIGKATIEPF